MITKDTKIYECEHLEKVHKENPDINYYVQIYAGESVRMNLCRLCSTMTLGVIVSSRIHESFNPEILENRKFL